MRPPATTSAERPEEPTPAADAPPVASLRVDGSAVVYRLYDVGYALALDRVLDLLASSAPERVRPVRGEAQAIQIPNPPVTAILGAERIVVGGRDVDAEVSARLFDFGVVSVRVMLRVPPGSTWEAFTRFGNALEDAREDLSALAAQYVRLLTDRLRPAIERPMVAPQTEDYIVFRLSRLVDPERGPVEPAVLGDPHVVSLLLNERRPLSAQARRELLPHRFSYYADDLAILTWENALVVDPEARETDVEYVLEFANAQLLELRWYDAELDAELPRMYERVAVARRRGALAHFTRGFGRILADLQRTVADSTELVERVENSFKVTDDVYLARVYAAALDIFRGRAWRAGIDRKLAIIRDTYGMLNDQAQATRAELLELTIVLLIVLEIVLAFVVPR